MGVESKRYTEYHIVCDVCGHDEVVFTGDMFKVGKQEYRVIDKESAIKLSGFARRGNQIVCDDCHLNGRGL